MRTWFVSAFILGMSFLLVPKPVHAEIACATAATMQDCVACGSAKYGYENQVAYCRNNWKPGRKAQSFDQYRKKHPRCDANGCPIN